MFLTLLARKLVKASRANFSSKQVRSSNFRKSVALFPSFLILDSEKFLRVLIESSTGRIRLKTLLKFQFWVCSIAHNCLRIRHFQDCSTGRKNTSTFFL